MLSQVGDSFVVAVRALAHAAGGGRSGPVDRRSLVFRGCRSAAQPGLTRQAVRVGFAEDGNVLISREGTIGH